MARQPDPADVMGLIRDLQRQVKDLATAAGLSSSSIGSGGLRSANYVPGVSGYMLQADKLEVGDIELRGGIIGNDALANPVTFGFATNSQTGFATSTSDVAYAASTIAVPSGFSQALVTCTAYVGTYNGTGAFDYLYVQARIAGVDAGEVPVSVDNGQFRGSHTAKVRLLTGLSGGTIGVAAVAHTQNAPWAVVSSRAYVEATAIFIR